ncbi:nucleotidyltransferase domain-containing protein [Synergistaceae bacterium OttesenSCG-928-I11]|nr:nucleotidyltransferase domain-containing protein [Synergistaceae bacterium OttesenSCG-928-I11]
MPTLSQFTDVFDKIWDDTPIEKFDEESPAFIKKLTDKFIRRLRDIEGDNLLRVVLFGSTARGEAAWGSDVDLFVLLKNAHASPRERIACKERIQNIAFDVDVEISNRRTFISPFIWSVDEYEKARIADPIFHDISAEGLVLYDSER